jgi:hypothetical protein
MYYPHIIAEDIRSLKGISSGEYIEENCKASGKVPPVELAVNHLNIYTTACMWQDPDQNIDLVLNEYYEKFYGPAAKEMKAFIEFSEANWGKMEKNVELVNKCLELMDAARKVAGEDGIYARRVALVDSYLYKLRQIREKLVLGRKENPKVRIYDKENDNTVNIDGKLDEKFWQGIASYPLRDPATGKKPVLETRFRTAWKGGNLYFGIDCKEDDTKKLNSATMKDDDPNIWNGDTVEILLETQGHSYYQFVVNPAGAMLDADRKRGINTLWNSDAKVATHVGDGYWSMEICIPVADEMQEENLPNQLVSGRRPVAKDPWYFNVARVRVRDKTSVSVYSFAQGEKVKFHDLDKFGILSFEK